MAECRGPEVHRASLSAGDTTILNSNPFLARPAISSSPPDRKADRSRIRLAFINRPIRAYLDGRCQCDRRQLFWLWCTGSGTELSGDLHRRRVNNVYGIWQSNNDAQSWIQIGTYPENSLDYIKTISGDPNIYGQVYVGFGGSGYAYLPAAPVGPTVTGVAASPSTGIEVPGNTVTLTLTMSEAVTVTGTPTLTLNDGGTATYSGGSGTNALTFSYTVSPSDSNVSALAVTQVNEPNGATITDSSGNAATLSLSGLTQSGPQIDPPILPTISSLVESPASGDLNAGKTVTLTVNLNEAVTVAGGTPTLTLNDGGTATYVSGSGTNALVFSYTVGAGQNTSGLSATGS